MSPRCPLKANGWTLYIELHVPLFTGKACLGDKEKGDIYSSLQQRLPDHSSGGPRSSSVSVKESPASQETPLQASCMLKRLIVPKNLQVLGMA